MLRLMAVGQVPEFAAIVVVDVDDSGIVVVVAGGDESGNVVAEADEFLANDVFRVGMREKKSPISIPNPFRNHRRTS